jgi:hypothetical protein
VERAAAASGERGLPAFFFITTELTQRLLLGEGSGYRHVFEP